MIQKYWKIKAGMKSKHSTEDSFANTRTHGLIRTDQDKQSSL